MADDITLDAGTGGAKVATDDDGTRHWPYTKVTFGANNTQTIVGSISSNPLPVALSDTDNAVLDNIQTAVQLIDDAIYVDDADWTDGSSKHMLVGGLFETSPQTITAGDVGPIQVTANGYIIVSVNGTVVLGAGTAEIGKLAAGTAEIGKLAAGVAEIGNVKNSGTFVVQVDGAALTALQLIDDAIYADDADWSDGTSKHMLVGGLYQLSPQTITDGDVGPFQVTSNGFVIVSVNGTVTVSGTGTFTVDGSATTQPVSAASLPLPSGASTSANQDTGNSTLSSIQTAVEIIDNVVYTHDAAGGTAVGNMIMAQRDDEVGSTATTDSDGDAQVLTTNKFGQLKTTQLSDQTSEVKYAVINAASGDNEIVAAAGVGVKIVVLNVMLIAGGTTDCRFESAAGGTALTGIMKLTAQSGFAPGYCPVGHFQTGDNAALSLECTGDIDGWLVYVEV